MLSQYQMSLANGKISSTSSFSINPYVCNVALLTSSHSNSLQYDSYGGGCSDDVVVVAPELRLALSNNDTIFHDDNGPEDTAAARDLMTTCKLAIRCS